MSDVAMTVLKVVPTGLTPVDTGSLSVANNYQFPNDGRMFLHVKNGGGSPDTVTIVTPGTIGGLALGDRTVSVPAGQERMIGPFPPSIYNDSNGKVNVTHSFITSVTHAVYHLS